MTLTLDDVLVHLSKIPEPPKSAVQAIHMFEDANVSVNKVSEFISMDETLTAKLLRLSNSSYYGFHSKITTVKESIVRLGVSVVKCALYSSMLESTGMHGNPFFYELWKSSLFTAFVAKDVSQLLAYNKKEVAFTSGLLCDIGQILINSAAEEVYPKLISEARKNNYNLVDVERQVFGFTHVDVGCQLANSWKLPLLYQNIIRFHHQPQLGQNQLLADDFKLLLCTYSANSLSPLFVGDPNSVELDMNLFKTIGYPSSSSADLIVRLSSQFDSYLKQVNEVSEMMFGASANAEKQVV